MGWGRAVVLARWVLLQTRVRVGRLPVPELVSAPPVNVDTEEDVPVDGDEEEAISRLDVADISRITELRTERRPRRSSIPTSLSLILSRIRQLHPAAKNSHSASTNPHPPTNGSSSASCTRPLHRGHRAVTASEASQLAA